MNFGMVGRRDPAVPSRGRLPTIGWPITADYLLSHLGYFGLLPVLPLLVGGSTSSSAEVGLALLVYSATVTGSCLLVGDWIARIQSRHIMVAGLAAAALGVGLLSVVTSFPGIIACLVLAGCGSSVHGLVARALVADLIPSQAGRNAVYSMLQIGVNVAAAVGPGAATWAFTSGQQRGTVLALGVCYVLAACAVAGSIPSGHRPGGSAGRARLRWSSLRLLVENRGVRMVAVHSAVGWFLYAQFFSAFAISISANIESSLVRASMFTLNAVVVVALQPAVTRLVTHRIADKEPVVRILRFGVLLFCGGQLLLALPGPAVAVAYAAVVAFSTAETVFTPLVSTAFAELDTQSTIISMNLGQFSTAVGQSLGAFSGGALFSVALGRDLPFLYWTIVVAVAVAVLSLFRPGRRAVLP